MFISSQREKAAVCHFFWSDLYLHTKKLSGDGSIKMQNCCLVLFAVSLIYTSAIVNIWNLCLGVQYNPVPCSITQINLSTARHSVSQSGQSTECTQLADFWCSFSVNYTWMALPFASVFCWPIFCKICWVKASIVCLRVGEKRSSWQNGGMESYSVSVLYLLCRMEFLFACKRQKSGCISGRWLVCVLSLNGLHVCLSREL